MLPQYRDQVLLYLSLRQSQPLHLERPEFVFNFVPKTSFEEFESHVPTGSIAKRDRSGPMELERSAADSRTYGCLNPSEGVHPTPVDS